LPRKPIAGAALNQPSPSDNEHTHRIAAPGTGTASDEPGAENPVVATVRNATVHLGGKPVVQDVSLSLHAGEIMVLLGPNGAGKTTLMRALYGGAALSGGSVLVAGMDPRRERKARRRIGFVPQEVALYPRLTVGENLETFAILAGLPRREARLRVCEVLDTVGLSSAAGRLVGILSGGTQYTTLLRGIELWGAVQADGPGRLAGDEEPPATNGRLVSVEQDFSQQIKADPEDRLSPAFVGLDDDRPVFRLPFTNRVGERKGHSQHGEKLADPSGVDEVGVLEIEAARLGGRKKRFDLPPTPILSQGDLRIGVGGNHQQVPADQPGGGQFQRRSKRAVA
jgi:predicted ABC-type transport system involved in lysophospholipase L1 biosynthesis ATPase subunit